MFEVRGGTAGVAWPDEVPTAFLIAIWGLFGRADEKCNEARTIAGQKGSGRPTAAVANHSRALPRPGYGAGQYREVEPAPGGRWTNVAGDQDGFGTG